MQIRGSLLAIRYSFFAFCFLLFTVFCLLFTGNVFAQTINYDKLCQEITGDPPPTDFPNPLFVEPKWDELDDTPFKTTVVDHYTISVPEAKEDEEVGGTIVISDIKLPYAKEIADYLEGQFLDEAHRLADFRNLTASQILSYNGPIVELTPQEIQDRLRADYVHALVELGTREPATFNQPNANYKIPDIHLTYSDFCGQNLRTIYDLVRNWGFPQPPSLKENPTPNDWERWLHTWGKYWPKIPLHDPGGAIACDLTDFECRKQFPEGVFGVPPNMRSKGCLVFTIPPAGEIFPDCPIKSNPPKLQVVRLGVPDLMRLDTLARFVQQLISPQQIIKTYFCKFRGLGQFCEKDQDPQRLGQTGFPQGEVGVGGNQVFIYDENGEIIDKAAITIVGKGPSVEFKQESKFPYLGLIFGKLTSAITGTFKYFDPLGILADPVKYQQNSTQIPADMKYFGSGTISPPPRIWAGFLSGIKKSKDFVICSLLPSQEDAQACAARAGL